MAQAYILIQTEVGKATTIAERIRQLPGVITADDVVGPYDVVVRIDGNGDPGSSPALTGIQQVAGITRTLTCEVPARA